MSNLFNKIKRTYAVGNLNNEPRYFNNLTDAQKEALALKDAGWMDVRLGYGTGGESLPEMFERGEVVGPTRDDYVDHLMEKRMDQFDREQLEHDMWERFGKSHYAPYRTRNGIQVFTDDMPEPTKPYMPTREEIDEMLRKRQGQPTGEEL